LTLWGGAYWALSIALAERAFHLGNAGVGFINASYAVGGLLGGFLVAATVSRLGPTLVFIAAAAASSITEVLFGLSPAGMLPFLSFFLTGLVDSLSKVTATSIIQVTTPRHLLGRVFGAFESLFIFAMAIGSLIAGPLISTLGARTACVLIALIGFGLLVLAMPFLLRLERVLGVRLFLFQVPVLNVLPFELTEELVRRLSLERYRAGDTIVRQGDVGDRMYIVKSGRVGVLVESNGREMPLTVLTRTDYFGEIALLQDVPRTATCRCLEAVEVYALQREDFQELLNRSDAFDEAIRAESIARNSASQHLLLLRA
jgi:CRP-like cAMP-binding protein